MAIDIVNELRVMGDNAPAGKRYAVELYGRAADEIVELRRRLGGGCDANDGGDHHVITEGRYKFCGNCGESLRGIRYCHEPK